MAIFSVESLLLRGGVLERGIERFKVRFLIGTRVFFSLSHACDTTTASFSNYPFFDSNEFILTFPFHIRITSDAPKSLHFKTILFL